MNTSLALMGLGGGELMVVLIAVLVLFGARKIPEFAKGLGQGIKEFKKASRDVTEEFHAAVNNDETQHSAPKPAAPAVTVSANPPATVPKA